MWGICKHGDYKFEPSSDELKVTASAKFKDRDADITFVFDEDLYLDSTTIDAHYSIGEIMEKAGLNTILGMGTVFVILIFISILISLFKYIPALEEKFKNKGKAESTQEAAPAPAAPSPPPATRCGTTRKKPLGLSASPGPRMRSTSIFTPKRRQRLT